MDEELDKFNDPRIVAKAVEMTPGGERHKLIGNYLRLVAPNPDEKIIQEIEDAIKNRGSNGN